MLYFLDTDGNVYYSDVNLFPPTLLSLSSYRFVLLLLLLLNYLKQANRILEQAMDPKKDGLHPDLFDPDLLGIAFMTVWEAGLIFRYAVYSAIDLIDCLHVAAAENC